MITNKEHLIDYFSSGIRDTKNFKIGIEHEKFLFDQNKNFSCSMPILKSLVSLIPELKYLTMCSLLVIIDLYIAI